MKTISFTEIRGMDRSKENIIVLSASSRKEGHTNQVMQKVAQDLQADYVDLTEKDISYYDYEHENLADDFVSIATQMAGADVIILGTPVYWYTMSAQMKTFLDRWSDLVTVRKDLGRALKGKNLILVSCGSSEDSVPGFEIPFRETAGYMDMYYGGHFATWMEAGEKIEQGFVQKRVNLQIDLIKQKLYRN